MQRDLGKKTTVYFNRYYTNNFALGFDYYKLYSHPEGEEQAAVLQLSFLFFNITINRWVKAF